MAAVKTKRKRVRLTHLEVRRGERLRLRVAVADDALADVGDELGALLKKIAPGTRTTVVEAPASDETPAIVEGEIVVSQQHADDDATYHATLRDHLTELITSLCDASLADALEIAREERARRAEGGN